MERYEISSIPLALRAKIRTLLGPWRWGSLADAWIGYNVYHGGALACGSSAGFPFVTSQNGAVQQVAGWAVDIFGQVEEYGVAPCGCL
jgi:hypothetical protein